MDLKNKKGLIVFVRHGQTDWNTKGLMQGREDIPLNETGLVFDKIVSSPLLRASVTAEAIAKALGCKNMFCDLRVTERDFGVLSCSWMVWCICMAKVR